MNDFTEKFDVSQNNIEAMCQPALHHARHSAHSRHSAAHATHAAHATIVMVIVMVLIVCFLGLVVANRVKKEKKVNFGYDALNEKYGDMLEFGVIDPTKVVRTSLQNAASVASLLMTTDCIVVNEPKKADDEHHDDHHHDGGMGGMGGMGGGMPGMM